MQTAPMKGWAGQYHRYNSAPVFIYSFFIILIIHSHRRVTLKGEN